MKKQGILALTIGAGHTVKVGNGTVSNLSPYKVRLAFKFPKEVPITRDDAKKQEAA